MKAELCPVCNGRGVFSEDEGGCHGCAEWGSKGWLLIPEQEDLPMPYVDGNDATTYKEVPATTTWKFSYRADRWLRT